MHAKQLLILFYCSFSCFLTAQRIPYEWGNISEAERTRTVYEKDSSANALILMNHGVIRINYPVYSFTYYKRIKLLKEAAFDLADVALPYYKKNKVESISKIKARITLPNGIKIDLTKKDFFEEAINDKWAVKKFAFPKVMVGAILEYEYTVLSEDLFHLRDFYFQETLPILHSELAVVPAPDMNYAIITQENAKGDLKRVDEGGFVYFKIMDVPAFKEEPFVTCLEDHYCKIEFQLSFFGRPYLTSWKQTAGTLRQESFFGAQYLKKKNFKKALANVQKLVTKEPDIKKKVQQIYQYFNQILQWNGQYRYSVQSSLNEVYEKRVGSSGELNLLLLGVLKELDIEAVPMLISTRSHGKMDTIYPMMEQFNHVLVRVALGEETWLLDLSDPHRPINYPKVEALNYAGWVVDGKHSEWVKVEAPYSTDVFTATVNLQEDGTLVGALTGMQKGYSAIYDRNLISEEKEGQFWQNRLSDQFPDIQLDSIYFENVDTPAEVLKTTIACTIPNAAMKIEEFLYLSPILYTDWEENQFKAEKRIYSVDFPYPFRKHFKLSLTIPEGYEVVEMPESVNFKMANEEGTFSYHALQKDASTIHIRSRIHLKEVHYEPIQYPMMRAFFDVVANKFQEQIVLKKVE